MIEILTGEFFWGTLIGLMLSIIGSYFLSRFTVKAQTENQLLLIKRLCRDTAKNIKKISEEFDEAKNRTNLIYADYLELIDIELNVFARNREHLVLLKEDDADYVRKFFTDLATRKAEVLTKLGEFNRAWSFADQVAAAGRGPEAERLRTQAQAHLDQAKASADRLVSKAKEAEALNLKLLT